MTRYSHAAAHREARADSWDEFKTTMWWKRERLRDWRRDPGRFKDDVAGVLARHLPGRLKYWAAIDVMVFATTGRYSSTVVPELLAVDALDRWHKCH